MGRSFDRGGQNRKEKERGKRRAYQQAERDREARDAVLQAQRATALATLARKKQQAVVMADAVDVAVQAPNVVELAPQRAAAAAAAEQKRPGLLSQMFKFIFKKSA
jgi:hypothetical protein